MRAHLTVSISIVLICLVFNYQNCAPAVYQQIRGEIVKASSCGNASCDLTPLTSRVAVTTILLALGDAVNNQLVGNSVSNRFLVESVIRYTSPEMTPKILIVRGRDTHGEDPEDTIYIQSLLSSYQTTVITEAVGGLTPDQVKDFDLVWFNNPGYPFSIQKTYQTLLDFPGAVVIQGDDLSQGTSFSVEALTGLKFIDNGTSVTCAGKSYAHDNNNGEQYRVSLNPEKIEGLNQSTIAFRYGNDIDNTKITNANTEILAVAVGGPTACTETRPVIVRREK